MNTNGIKRMMPRSGLSRDQALSYVGQALDDTGAIRKTTDIPANAVLVGWSCGFEPMFVAVFSAYGWLLDRDEAAKIAKDYLSEIGWFAADATEPDFIIR